MIRRRAGVLALLLLAVLAPMETLAAAPTDGCCATCIGKPSAKPYSYDPLVYAQCSSAGGVCCFNCDSEKSSPTIENADFGDDGITPQVKVGEWVQVTWPNIARVTYESYKVNQAKTTTVTNGSAEATFDSGVFFICARSAGSISMRGWGKDSCTSVTPESTIVVLPGTSNGTCASRTPVAPTATTAAPSGGSKAAAATVSADPMIAQCNLQRASIVTLDGKQTCVCAAEWTGAPDCAGFPWWKTAATIGGGIAALLSIAVSIKAFMNARKVKEIEEQQQAANGNLPVLGEESIRIASTPVISNRASQQTYEPPPATIKANETKEKEYTL